MGKVSKDRQGPALLEKRKTNFSNIVLFLKVFVHLFRSSVSFDDGEGVGNLCDAMRSAETPCALCSNL